MNPAASAPSIRQAKRTVPARSNVVLVWRWLWVPSGAWMKAAHVPSNDVVSRPQLQSPPIVHPAGGNAASSKPCARLPPARMFPLTCSLSDGAAVPIPTFPALLTRTLSAPFVLNTSDWLSVVPRKLVPGVVPALPVRLQPPAPPPPEAAWHDTVPSALITRIADPNAQVPVTRFWKARASKPSRRSVFRLTTLADEFTLSGAIRFELTSACRPGPPPMLRPVTPAEAGSVEFVCPNTPEDGPVPPLCSPDNPSPLTLWPSCPVPEVELPLIAVPVPDSARMVAPVPELTTLSSGFPAGFPVNVLTPSTVLI